MVETATCRGRLGDISRGVVGVAVWRLLIKIEGTARAGRRHAMGAGTFCSNRFRDLIYLAANVCRQATQNAVGDTQFIRGGQPAMGGGVRMADRRPKTSKL